MKKGFCGVRQAHVIMCRGDVRVVGQVLRILGDESSRDSFGAGIGDLKNIKRRWAGRKGLDPTSEYDWSVINEVTGAGTYSHLTRLSTYLQLACLAPSLFSLHCTVETRRKRVNIDRRAK